MRTRTIGGVMLLVGALALAGCGSDNLSLCDKCRTSPTPTPTLTPSPSVTPASSNSSAPAPPATPAAPPLAD